MVTDWVTTDWVTMDWVTELTGKRRFYDPPSIIKFIFFSYGYPYAHHYGYYGKRSADAEPQILGYPGLVGGVYGAYAGLPAAPAVVAAETPAATVAVAHAAPVAAVHAAPALVHAAPAIATTVHTAPVVQHVGYQVHHQVQHVPQVSVQKHVTHHTTQHVINHAPVVGAYAGLPLAGLPVVAAAAPAVVEDAE